MLTDCLGTEVINIKVWIYIHQHGCSVNTLEPLNRVSTGSERKRWCERANRNVLVVMESEPITYSDRQTDVNDVFSTSMVVCDANKPDWIRETEEDDDNNECVEGRWRHSGPQGDERSEPGVTSLAQNRRWVIPASSHREPIRELPVTTCINRYQTAKALVFL